jgi:hypothetical protein
VTIGEETEMTEAVNDDADDFTSELRQLALVDRIIGLEAEVARLSSRPVEPAPVVVDGAEIERLHDELRAIYGSRAWRVGNLVLRPVRVVRRLGRS